MNNFGYMNIKTELVKKSKYILTEVLKGNKRVPDNWIYIAENENFTTLKDWIKKELALVEWELETRRRHFKGE